MRVWSSKMQVFSLDRYRIPYDVPGHYLYIKICMALASRGFPATALLLCPEAVKSRIMCVFGKEAWCSLHVYDVKCGVHVSDSGWVTFGNEGTDEDQTVPSFHDDEQQQQQQAEEEEEEEEEETDGKASRPERPPLPAAHEQKSRDEIAKERALAKYSAQLEQGWSRDCAVYKLVPCSHCACAAKMQHLLRACRV